MTTKFINVKETIDFIYSLDKDEYISNIDAIRDLRVGEYKNLFNKISEYDLKRLNYYKDMVLNNEFGFIYFLKNKDNGLTKFLNLKECLITI